MSMGEFKTGKPQVALAVALMAFAIAGCGDDNNDSKTAYTGTQGESVPVKFTDADGATQLSTKQSKVGEIISGQNDRTLYTFGSEPGKSIECRGECAWTWLPVVAGRGVTISGGVQKDKVGAVKYSDKATQLTYGGYPLYFYAEDTGKGSINGNGKESFGATWSAVTPDGTLASK